MLDSHLIARTSPSANRENIVLWEDYRVTVLQDRLFRVECNRRKKFRDEATQTVWFRDMPPQKFTVEASPERAVIQTESCRLILRKNRQDCTIFLGDRERALDNAGNLLGTYRTLDGCDGDVCRLSKRTKQIALGTGVCSKTGVALFDDASSLTLGQDGEVKAERGEGTDEYIFAYGNDYRAAVKALFSIAGSVPLLPRYALGNWWSRFHDYTDREYLRLLNRFEENDVPLTVATVDMDWHYSKNVEQELNIQKTEEDLHCGMLGWTGYTWNKNLFPDYQAFLREVNGRNLKVTLNLHPSDGVRRWEEQYVEMARSLGVDPSSQKTIAFDIADPVFLNCYFSVLHKPYERDGVEFWWIDWQQGTQSSLEGLDPLWSLNHYHFLDAAKNHAQPLILSRYAGIGSHRYPLGFSGDTFVTWKTLRYLPYFTATASNVGYCWWSHDIGGHMCGEMSGELYVRFIQLGVFSPINRLHCCDFETMTKEPWVYGSGAGKIAEEFLRLRHRMIPYLYTQSYRLHRDGIAPIEPVYYRFDEEGAYEAKEEYFFGSELLVAPVTQKAQKDGYTRISAWLPEGKWTDIFTGDEYVAPKGVRTTLVRSLDSIPVLAKAGAILPFSADRGNASENPHTLEIWVYTGNGGFELYEDGLTRGDSSSFTTCFHTEERENGQRLKITSNGNGDVIPRDRSVRVCFRDIEEGSVALYADGEQIGFCDKSGDCLKLEFDFCAGREYLIEVSFQRKDRLQGLIRRARDILTRAEGNNVKKLRIWKALAASETTQDFLQTVESASLSRAIKARLTETIVSDDAICE